jgi:hypothetical protein
MEALTLEAALDLEREVWEALVHGDPEADAAMLSADFLGVYPTGMSDREAHAGQLEHGPTAAVYRLSEAVLRWLAPDCVLLAYRADWRRRDPDGTVREVETMYVSSIWCARDERWENVFSQDTPTAPSRDL